MPSPNSDHDRGERTDMRVLAVETITWLRGTTLEVLGPAAGSTPWELSKDGVGASGLLTEEIGAALQDGLATGTREPSKTKRGVASSVVDGQAGCAVQPSKCPLPVRNVLEGVVFFWGEVEAKPLVFSKDIDASGG